MFCTIVMSPATALWITILCMVYPANSQTGKDLLTTLFTNYSTNVRPVTNSTAPITVNVRFSLTSFEVIEKYQEIRTRGWFIFIWKDEFLTWNETVYPISKLILKPSLVWLPDMSIGNAKSDRNLLHESIAPVAVFPDGTVSWSPEVTLATSCTISVSYFPFDSQVCGINMVPWHSEPNEQLLTNTLGTIMVDTIEDNTEWQYIGSEVTAISVGPFSLSTLTFTLKVKRLASYHIIHTFIPTVFSPT